MVPRQALGASPFAIQAQQANQLGRGPRSRGASHRSSFRRDHPRVQVTGTITAATISGATLTQLQGQLAAGVQPPRQPPSPPWMRQGTWATTTSRSPSARTASR